MWLAGLIAVLLAVPALAKSASPQPAPTDPPSLAILVPDGIAHGFVATEPGPKPGTKFVVIQNVVVRNPNPSATVGYNSSDFSLIVEDKRYYPQARPKLGAIDISGEGVLGPRNAIKGNLVFLVPDDVYKGSVEFRPMAWYTSGGAPVIYCCYPGKL